LFPPEHRPDAGVASLNNRLVWNPGEAAMPQANRFAFMRHTVRSHPFLIASWAAMGGILLGGFVTLKMLQPEPRAAKVGPAQAVAEAKPKLESAPKPVAETTGSAPAGESAAADCDHQTWPNFSRVCIEAMQAKNRGPRVISTDNKPTVSASEAPSPSPAATQPPAATPVPVTAETTPVTSPAPANPAPAAAVAAAPQSSSGALVGKAQAEEKPPQPADQKEAKQEKHERVAKKARRKPKVEPKAQPKDESNDDDDHVANAEDQATVSDNPPSDDRIARGRADRRRVVERRPAREYNVPADDGSGDQRIMVIRRDNGGGIFGNLFGGFGD
jgi:hypothetical protein